MTSCPEPAAFACIICSSSPCQSSSCYSFLNAIVQIMCSTVHCCRAPHIIQSQLVEVMSTLVYCDYPAAWPGLLEAVMVHLTSNVSKARPRCWHWAALAASSTIVGKGSISTCSTTMWWGGCGQPPLFHQCCSCSCLSMITATVRMSSSHLVSLSKPFQQPYTCHYYRKEHHQVYSLISNCQIAFGTVSVAGPAAHVWSAAGTADTHSQV